MNSNREPTDCKLVVLSIEAQGLFEVINKRFIDIKIFLY